MADNEAVSDQIYNEFLLNEIKVKNDALKQLLSVDALLMGGYAAILLNNLNYKMPVMREGKQITLVPALFGDLMADKPFYLFGVDIQIFGKLIILVFGVFIMIFILLILTGPLICWYFSMKDAMESFASNDVAHSYADLKRIVDEKNLAYSDCYDSAVYGIGIVVVIIFLVMFWGVFV